MAGLAFDTCFLIDMQRELRRGQPAGAQNLLHQHAHETAYLSAVALGEFAEGFASHDHPVLAEVRSAFVLLDIDDATARHYAEIVRVLRRAGQLIGANDLWIAASARCHRLPLVTNNLEHLARVPGLRIVTY